MEELTKEEVLHVASLARIAVSDTEIDQYKRELKQLLDDVDKIKMVDNIGEETLVTPLETTKEFVVRKDEVGEMTPFHEFKENAPHTVGEFIEVPLMVVNNRE